ncbi:hypothetical protein CONCODRAFT_74507 [Conidiobolus coronatus NRRL 28638]|uniref:Uncharacterized protein n=1 Tax=Conidiobolus coronatus (strain ATCC 28846 / CBS 209.66 / NRRL 28638) TaxID=796925 RepID=A0A137NQR8_CONC2|nr:hypothetical protein CONCODRAFT_74507 [Conidiobolus coronatus NRRL 28638]|eukprot:KXN65020.1 hypothetical protein CONCODRAFT_74507 [Conidiobolus coronatus NRRL 28638]
MVKLIQLSFLSLAVTAAPAFYEIFSSIPVASWFMNHDPKNRLSPSEILALEQAKFNTQAATLLSIAKPQQIVVTAPAPVINISNNVSSHSHSSSNSNSNSNSQSYGGGGGNGGYGPPPPAEPLVEEDADSRGICYRGSISAIPPGGRMCED